MFARGDVTKSHLFQHGGNYFGTWQRIDIPKFINEEYVLLLDCDTIILDTFDHGDFGLEMTESIAFSAESNEDLKEAWNAGVALMNLPYLRATYDDFLRFIETHQPNAPFQIHMDAGGYIPAPSDQGAYLFFYYDTKKFLDKSFNDKPYYKHSKDIGNASKVLHFHGPKPHDYIGNWLGVPCKPAVRSICEMTEKETPNLCKSLKAFADTVVLNGGHGQGGDTLVEEYCDTTMGMHGLHYADSCVKFFTMLAKSDKHTDCRRIATILSQKLL